MMRLPVISLLVLLTTLATTSVNAADRRTLADVDADKKQGFIENIPAVKANSSAIFEYRKFLQVSEKGSLVRRQVMIRLAEIELDLAERLLADEITEAEQKQVAAGEQPLDVTHSLVSGVELFEAALKEYPDNPDNDRVLYLLARGYDLAAKPEKRVDALQRLVQGYNGSAYYTESQFRLAEYYFVSRQYKPAAAAYTEVLKKETEFSDNALYKRGWSYFKLAQYQRGLDDFIGVLDKYSAGEMDSLSRIEKELYQDTLRVISLSFAYLKGVESLNKYFAGKPPAHYIRDIYYALGQHYLEKKRYADTVAAYMAFADRYPENRYAPVMVFDTIEVWQKSQFPAKVLAARETFATRYRLNASFWKTHAIKDFPRIHAELKKNIYLLAEYHHSLGQKLKNRAEKRKAVHWYAEYIASFKDDKRTPHLHFLYAELLSELNEQTRAFKEYDAAAYNYGMVKDSAEAAYASVLSAVSLTQVKFKDQKQQTQHQKTWRAHVINSTLKFAKHFPKDKRVKNSLLFIAEMQYQQGRMLESAELAQRVLPGASREQKVKALVIIGHSQFELELYRESVQTYQQLLKLTGKKHKEYKKIRKRVAIAIYKEGDLARKAGDSTAAIAAFLRVRTAVPEASIVPTAEFDAATELVKTKQWDRAIPVLQRFRKSYPGNKWQNDVTSKLAVAYTETANYARAAAEYAVIAGFVKKPEQKRVAYYQVAEFYEKAGKTRKAITAYEGYLKRYTQPFDIAMEVRSRLIDLYGKLKQRKKQNLWRERVILSDKKAGKQRTERSKYLAAVASMALADQAAASYRWVKLKAPFKKNLKKKKLWLKKAVNAYAKVLEYKIADSTTEAVYKIGEIYNNFSKSLMKSERPKNLSALELEQYDILLEEQAFPFDEKAIEFHRSNLQRTKENIYDKWIRKSVKRLGELYPGRYLRKEKLEVVIDG